jgi:elongation factor G
MGKSVLLEPIMKVEVVTPREYAKPVIDDFRLRCGEIEPEVAGATVTIRALAPLMNLFGYDGALRALSNGQATSRMQFDHYAPAKPSPEDDPFRPAIGMRA